VLLFIALEPQLKMKSRSHHEGPERQSRNQSSEYLPQRREGRKGRKIRV